MIVALRKESVDRNWQNIDDREMISAVALRKESVDRNMGWIFGMHLCKQSLSARRAWIEMLYQYVRNNRTRSLSARRAWIEMEITGESRLALESLSARRAWIEIESAQGHRNRILSLSARRAWIEMSGHRQAHTSPASRSPQGERG